MDTVFFDEHDEIGNFVIYRLCLESEPCQHYVTNKTTKQTQLLDGLKILKLLKDNNLFLLSHFAVYQDYNQIPISKTQGQKEQKEQKSI